MSDFTPTPEQLAIVQHVAAAERNLVVEARAGAAKTSTLVLAAAEARGPVLSLAFNKAIKEEMQQRMPSGVTCQTLHGCGFAAWRQYLGRNVSVSVQMDKVRTIFRNVIAALPKKEQDEAWESYGEIMKAISAAKNAGCLFGNVRDFQPLQTPDDFFLSYVVDFSDFEKALISEISAKSWAESLLGVIDFDDMVLCPAVARVSFPFYRTILVDEAQDLAEINRVLIGKLARSERCRVIAVGDPCQAIYGFRGADTRSLDAIRKTFDCDTLYLTTSFRCPSAVVAEAQWRAPDMRWPEWAEAGQVLTPESWSIDDIPDEAAIICRNNAPLYSMAMRLISEGRSCELSGRDITQNIVKELKGLQPKKQPWLDRDAGLRMVDVWEERKKRRIKDQKLVADQAECLRIFVNQAEDLGGAIKLAEALSNSTGRVKLMTGHRSKGLEFDTVFILDRQLLRMKGDSQDNNLLYVMQTRAKRNLIYITTENFVSKETVDVEEQ